MRKSVFGLSITVDRDWSWCPDAPAGEQPPLKALFGTPGPVQEPPPGGGEPYYRSPSTADNGLPVVQVDRMPGGRFRVRYSDHTEFDLDGAGAEIHARWPASSTLEDTLVYLQGPILGFALRLRGVTCLHASAAVVDGRALAVVGPAARGKSTIAAALATRSLAILTDDLLALSDRDGSFAVQPGLPRILLWPDSAQALFGDAEALPRIVPTWPKRYLDLTRPGYRFCPEPRPLGAIYVLGERGRRGSSPAIEPLEGTSALLHLVANSYANYLLDSTMRGRELEVLSRVVGRVRMRLVRAPEDRAAVPAVCEAILADHRAATGD